MTVHWQPPSTHRYRLYRGKTRCGRPVSNVDHSEDITEATCNTCVKGGQKDGAYERAIAHG